MSTVIALASRPAAALPAQLGLLRAVVVSGCALALILAKAPLTL